MKKPPRNATFLYERTVDTLRLKMTGMTNHELREILVGCWASLDEEDRADHIRELEHYSQPGSTLSDVARAIRAHAAAQKVVH